jgi:hypothetical protein
MAVTASDQHDAAYDALRLLSFSRGSRGGQNVVVTYRVFLLSCLASAWQICCINSVSVAAAMPRDTIKGHFVMFETVPSER